MLLAKNFRADAKEIFLGVTIRRLAGAPEPQSRHGGTEVCASVGEADFVYTGIGGSSMQPHEILGIFAMIMVVIAAVLLLGGKESADEQAKTIRKGWAGLFVFLGSIFIILSPPKNP